MGDRSVNILVARRPLSLVAAVVLLAACNSTVSPAPVTPLPRPSGVIANGSYLALTVSGAISASVTTGSVVCTVPWEILDKDGKQTSAGEATTAESVPTGAVSGIAYRLRTTDYPGPKSFELVAVVSSALSLASSRVILTSNGSIYSGSAKQGSLTLLPDGNGVAFHGLDLSTATGTIQSITLDGQAACR